MKKTLAHLKAFGPASALACLALLALLLAAAAPVLAASEPAKENERTTLGKYVDAREAYAMYKAAPDKVAVIDVRTPEEYVFVGHADMAYNMPSMFFSTEFNAEKKSYKMVPNPGFVELVKKHFKPGDTLLLMCRSGSRSAAAVNELAKAGFTDAYSVVDGFEGEMVKDKASPDFGKRTVNGWKNANPWTYSLDPALVFKP
ncbi:Rhodanese-like protein [Desulfovibrio sp. X2]|uniref:rhodanese-like domain-containing protein n=1 Tax=Desulfovibrio sp. X2 TaxID=941449 RepID=UPI000358EB67|nr:rhodanese-like domain-containing protein [Desulfovibrio sp. X2]EPR37263.1 Rhodanese-like protein [Desulfovibrio sp. X2]